MSEYIVFQANSKGEKGLYGLRDLEQTLVTREDFNKENFQFVDWDESGNLLICISTKYNIEDKELAYLVTEASTENNARLVVLFTNKKNDKYRFIIGGTKKLIVDEFWTGKYKPNSLKKYGVDQDDFFLELKNDKSHENLIKNFRSF